MRGELLHIGRYLAELGRRERVLSTLHGVRRASGLAAALAVGFAWAVRAGVPPATVVFVGVLAVGVGALWVAYPLLATWSAASDPRRHARTVESLAPALRGRLDAAASHLAGDVPVVSDALFALTVGRAEAALKVWPASRVRPVVPAAVATSWVAVPGVVVVALALATTVPVVRAWWAARPGGEVVAVAPAEAYGRFGNLDLVLVPPAYTGLPERRLDNTDGTIEALPGTRVRISAQSALAFESAGVVVGDAPAVPARALGPHRLEADLVAGAETTTWFILATSGGASWRSPPFPVVPRADHPPEVGLLVTDGLRLEVGVDDPIRLAWTVTDDFGIARVDLVVDAGEGFLVGAPWGAGRSIEGAVDLTPRDLGLRPGKEVDLFVVAWDNDAVSGAKEGRSAPVRLAVLGGAEPTDLARWRAIRDALVLALADDLVEPWPPDLRTWPPALDARHAPLLEGAPEDGQSDAAGMYVETVLVDAHILRTYAASIAGTRLDAARLAELGRLRDDLVVVTEHVALVADRRVVGAALVQAEEAAYFAALHAADVVRVLDRDGIGGTHVLLDRLVPELVAVETSLADLRDGPLRDQSSLAVGHALALARVLREGAVDGDPNLARDPAVHLARITAQLHADLAEALEGYLGREEEDIAKLREVVERLSRLGVQQHLVAGQVHVALDGARAPLASRWGEAAEVAGRLRGSMGDEGDDGVDDYLEMAIEAYEVSIAQEDFDGAWSALHRLVRYAERADGAVDPAVLAEAQGVTSGIVAARVAADRPDGLLAHVPTQEVARTEAQAIGGEIPGLELVPRAAREEASGHVVRAVAAMDRAVEALEHERGAAAESAMEEAAASVEAARDVLRRFMPPCETCAGGGSCGKCSKRGRCRFGAPGDVWIPPPDRSPEEYRRMLLDGMQGPVPEAYEALSTRYYEELVRQ